MTTIRRIYAYLLAFAGLAMLGIGVANLLQLLVDVVLQAPPATTEQYVRDSVSLFAAVALIGLPVWLLHWSWVQRTARADERERTSTLRRLYLYGVLTPSLLIMVGSTRDALFEAFDALLGAQLSLHPLDAVVRQVPFSLIAALIWLSHWRVLAVDRRLVGEIGGSATLRRWYVYGGALFGLSLLLGGSQAVLERLWRIAAQPTPSAGVGIAATAPIALVGLCTWLVHWIVLPNRLPPASRSDDGSAVLRAVYLFVALAIGVIGALLGASQLLYYAVARLLGVDRPGGVGGDLVQAAAGPACVALVYAANWAYQRQALRRQSVLFAEAPRQAGTRRLYTYLIALVGLGVLASSVTGLLMTLGNVAFNAPAATQGDGWRGDVALWATMAIVGLPVWLVHWRSGTEQAEHTRSLARRLYLYLSLIAAALTLIGSLGFLLYRLLRLVLGEQSSVGLILDITHALAFAIVAAVIAGYHWRLLRADADSHRTPPQTEAAPAAVVVEIQAADAASLKRALAALRATGVQVIQRGEEDATVSAPSGS